MCLTYTVCLQVKYRPYINLSYITIRLSDTYAFLCQYSGVNTMVDILALIYKVRIGHFLVLHSTQKHIQVQSFKFKMSKDLTALSWYNILQHIFIGLLQHRVFMAPLELAKKRKKHYMGHGVTSGMSWLICRRVTANRVSLSAPSVRSRGSTHQRLPPVWLWSSPFFPLRGQMFYVCLTLQRFSWLPHTLAVREVRPPVFQWNKMNGTHTPLKRLKRHVKFVAAHPRSEEFVGFLPLTQQSLTVFCETL